MMTELQRTVIKRLSVLYAACACFLILILQSGCATNHTIKHYGMVDEHFYGLGPVHAVSNAIIVQGITQVAPEGGALREHPSYVAVTIASNRVVATEWVDPGQLPEEALAQPLIPYQRDSLRGARERFADLRNSGSPAKFYGGNWLLLRNPMNPEEPFQFAVEPSRRYRAKSAYATYGVVLAGAFVFDVVTSPFQLIVYWWLNKSFKNVN